MFSKKIIKGIAVFASSALLSLTTVQSAYAAPGALATAPLFLSTIVEPNVFFTIDDSGSMDWGPMVQAGTAGFATSSGLPIINNDDRAYYTPTFSRLYTSRGYLPPWGENITTISINGTPTTDPGTVVTSIVNVINEWDRSWVVRNHNGNRNYYNPDVTYTPWAGTKADGSPMFIDADPTKALKDPSNPGGEWVDLTARHSFTSRSIPLPGPNISITTNNYYIPTYFIWNDIEDDGQIDQTDMKTQVEIAAGTAEMQNFANWFQYHRTRVLATKAIIGSTINNTDASRMGMRLFNFGHRDDVETMGDLTNKRDLLNSLYGIVIPARGTPMRISLRNTGNYFDNTGASAPILSAALGGECQQNFNILMGDGFWNGSGPGVGNADANGGSFNTPFDGNASQSNDGGNYADGNSNTLADVAMRDYERDLRGDLDNKVPTQPGVDEADHQHLVTYTIAFGINGTLDPEVDDPLAAGFSWPNPFAGTPQRVDDMWHAAYNGRGQYLSSQNPDELEAALNTAIADIAERTATAAAVSINSAKLTTESVVYLAQFNTNRWQGNLFAFKIVDLDTGELAVTPEWTAAEVLNARNIVSSPRVILTNDGTKGVPFQWDDLSAAQKDDLKTSPTGGVDVDAIGMARLNYLRGDQSNEGTGLFFRERLSLLADMVNSGPVFVAKPNLNWPDTAPFPTAPGARYSDFKNGPAASRPGVVYAGSNGGKMHGFAEADGEEVIAYIANNLFSTGTGEGLHYLTDPNFVHKYYNDLTPTVSDIYSDLGSGAQWQTVLVSGQRGGGRGIFALNVTNPTSFSETNASKIVLWEFSNADDADLGYTYSRPQIGLANNGRWVAIFGNGYNDTGDGKAKLFILDIAAGADGSWDAGDYIEITTNSGTTTDRNGLATPSLADLDGNGTIDRIYGGDLRGQMWVFDLSSTSSASWGIPSAGPLFTTINNEPITSKPALAKHPTISDDGSNEPNVMVMFGSGQYLVNSDKTSSDLNHFYGVWDRGDDGLDNTSLVQQTYENGFLDANGDPVRVLSRNVVNYAGGEYGWYFELPDSGERSVTNAVVRGGIVFFNSFVPVDDPCSVGGFGFRFAVDILTGGSPEDVAIDANNDGVIDDSDKASDGVTTAAIAAIRQEGFLPEPVFIEDIAYTAETPSKVQGLKKPPTGRFSWQELIQ